MSIMIDIVQVQLHRDFLPKGPVLCGGIRLDIVREVSIPVCYFDRLSRPSGEKVEI